MRPPKVIVAAPSLSGPSSTGTADLDRLVPGSGPWELEVGFGKGSYLLGRAAARPERRFAGIEVAGKYFRLAAGRARRRRLANVVLFCGEALYLLSAFLPAGFARTAHVYFPDPWPKSRHHKRRLFDADTLDLLLRALEEGGRLFFATDHLDYGAAVEELFDTHPGVEVKSRPNGWPDGPRTNYEAKYLREGRPILRLEIVRTAPAAAELFHPAGVERILAATAGEEE